MAGEKYENKISILPADRRKRIMQFIEQNESAQIKELALKIEVSEATIRRDLEYLSSEKLIKRTHGGAVIRSPSTSYEPLVLINQQ
ncbi:DeoR family transcriptional regulator [Halalkalibacter lacteus]|uniref:DeoR family transcriptional regulator n=1 Tax=Halalkalibacter lacteus TaxID=3090663 RepID=UPI002FC758F1